MLRPYSGNARTLSRRQIKQIADSIQRFGFTNAVLISDDNEIIAGHGRVLAARELGMPEVSGQFVPIVSGGCFSPPSVWMAERRATEESGGKAQMDALFLPEDRQEIDTFECLRSQFQRLPTIKNLADQFGRQKCQRQNATGLRSVRPSCVRQFGD